MGLKRNGRRRTWCGLLGLWAFACSGLVWAQNYPNKPIRLVVTFPTGGAPDTLARIFSEKAQLGHPVVVDNKPWPSQPRTVTPS
jgi:tripartite-type tricarboxylate transporter receptor subunit TctC